MKWLIIPFLLAMNVFGQNLELEWDYYHPQKNEWRDFGKKGSVQEVLIQSGEMPDPFYGTNENKFGWIENYNWEFKSLFYLSEEQLDHDFIELYFPNIDTYASVYLNDSLIYKADNAFIPHSVEMKKMAKSGLNELHLIIEPPVVYHKKMWDTIPYKLPAPNDVHEIAIAPFTRKPQYQFGWDWALRMNTIGLNKPVEVKIYNANRIMNKTIRTVSVSDSLAEMELEIFPISKRDSSFKLKSDLFGELTLFNENGRYKTKIKVENPELWWPNGQGDQYLYTDNWEVFSENGQLIERLNIRFGIKTSELIQEKDQWGTSYYFKINGRTIFCKGGDYIPQEIFPSKVTDDAIIEMVQQMKAANFNMVRVWGGGYYPDDIFFETCDELGIMVWEDLMFACSMYPGDSLFLTIVKKEFEYQIPRIAAHPSVVLFNGNNEVEVAWNNWGFQIKYGLYGSYAREIESAYDAIFKELAPGVVQQFSSIPYIHTSPLSNWGKMDYYNHGSQHYWGVWHGKDPMEDFALKIGRFNAEYGFQSFPEFNTLRSFAADADMDLTSEVMKHHQKSYVGNGMILKHAKRLYGKPADFEEIVYYSQLTQAKAVGMAISGHRLDFPRCGGTLYWQVNDCWPAPTWSSIDYYGNWKALHYEVEKDYEPITVLEKILEDDKKEYYLISDLPDSASVEIKCEIRSVKGKLLYSKEWNQLFNGNGTVQLDISEFDECIKRKNVLVTFIWKDRNGKTFERNFEKEFKPKKANIRDVEIKLTNINPEAKTAQLIINNRKFLRDCWITSTKFGVRFNRNFLNLLPGEHIIEINYKEIPELEDFKLMWR